MGRQGKVTEDEQVGEGGGGTERCVRCQEGMVGGGRINGQPDVGLEMAANCSPSQKWVLVQWQSQVRLLP